MFRVSYEVTDENFYECIEVSKQIFWMYHDISFYGGIVHNIDFEQVDYKKFIMCEILDERLKTCYLEKVVKLLNQGCFTALCCHVLNLMEEELRDIKIIKLIDNILEDERINDMKFEKDLLITMKNALKQKPTYQIDRSKEWTDFLDGNTFYEKLPEVYTNYVITYYQSMLKGNTI
ncbi:hypothetical protein SH2C18_35130 [Clostridium sediminicola]|uniref:hypothetical protein n=1 Tax=Clostridium sediminicola TaxID=3114879 RepID=UPI0031F1F814